MSTESYPEVSVDESAIVPSQSARQPEWPKKIRTLTAAELDRLTIDSAGRFYWDGQLVNYEPPHSRGGTSTSTDTTERQAMDIIDRAVYELGDRKTPEPIEGAELPRPVGVTRERGELRAVDLDLSQIEEQITGSSGRGTIALLGSERLQLRLSRWQSIGAGIMLVCVIVGCISLAAFGWVAAHDWGCRSGLIQNHCSGTTSPARSHADIPA